MGIISDFQDLNREIEECNNSSSVLNIITKIKCKRQKSKLIKIVDKLRSANTPLSRNEILELASSIYTNCIPDGIYKNIKVSFYNRSGTYKIFVDINENFGTYQLISSIIDVSGDEDTIHITVSTEDLKTKTTHSISMTSKDLFTNIKEAKDDVYHINTILINIMADYILDNIR